MRDTLSMRDSGADVVMDFTDAGTVCTSPKTAAQVSRVILSELAAAEVDVVVAETGDGIMGEYGVQIHPQGLGAARAGRRVGAVRE